MNSWKFKKSCCNNKIALIICKIHLIFFSFTKFSIALLQIHYLSQPITYLLLYFYNCYTSCSCKKSSEFTVNINYTQEISFSFRPLHPIIADQQSLHSLHDSFMLSFVFLFKPFLKWILIIHLTTTHFVYFYSGSFYFLSKKSYPL